MLFSGNLLLNNVELIVRYCWMEEPYWMSFIKHHYSLGVKRIHIILQSKKDIKSLESFTYPRDLQISINYFSSDLNPDQALIKFDIEQFKKSSKYKLILDCDEFIFSFKKDLKLNEI